MAKRITTLEAAVKQLLKDVKRLDPEHGIVGRRNSRTAVKSSLNRIAKFVDRDFPTIRKKAQPRRKRKLKPSTERKRFFTDMNRRGFVPTSNRNVVVLCEGAKVPVKRAWGNTWIPAWAHAFCKLFARKHGRYPSSSTLRSVRKDASRRRAAEAEWRLAQMQVGP